MRTLRLIMILGSALTTSITFSQGLELELLVRPALTSLRGNHLAKKHFDPTLNLSTGVSTNYVLAKRSLINLTILYDKKGATGQSKIVLRDDQNRTIGEETITHQSNFEYITIPVQWKQRFGDKLRYEFGIGVYTGFFLNQVTIASGSTFNEQRDDSELFKQFDFGVTASASIYLPIKKSLSMKVGLNDNLGLLNVSDVPVANDGTIKHNSLGLSAGLNYRVN